MNHLTIGGFTFEEGQKKQEQLSVACSIESTCICYTEHTDLRISFDTLESLERIVGQLTVLGLLK